MLKDTVTEDKSYNNIKENIIISCIFVANVIFLFVSKNKNSYGMLMHSIYATFLIAMGIIIFNTMKFNVDKFSLFLGVTFATTGIIEVIYVFMSVSLNNGIEVLGKYNTIISSVIDILPMVGMYISFNCIKSKKCVIKNILFMTISVIIGIYLIVNSVMYINSALYIEKIGIIHILVTLIMLVLAGFIYKKIKSNEIQLDKEEILYFNRIVFIIILSRVPILMSFYMKSFYNQEILSQIITNIAVYYLYKYIVYTNVKKPYIKLNNINQQLNHKTENLKKNNEKLIEETEKICQLKEMLKNKESKLQSKIEINNRFIDWSLHFLNDK